MPRDIVIIGPQSVKTLLIANADYYVRTNGNDANNGLANDAAHAFLTIQRAIDVALLLDFGPYTVTIHVADGTYALALMIEGLQCKNRGLVIEGNTATPANVIVTSVNATYATIALRNSRCVYVKDFTLTATGGAGGRFGIYAYFRSHLEFSNLIFGACGGAQVSADNNSQIITGANYEINGNAVNHLLIREGGEFEQFASTVTLTGVPAFSDAFAHVCIGGYLHMSLAINYAGAATGKRFIVESGGFVKCYGGGINFLPGNAAGSVAQLGNYDIDLGGAVVDVPYVAGDYTSDVGAWTVEAADVLQYSYMLIDKYLHLVFAFQNTTIVGAPVKLFAKLPLGLTATKFSEAYCLVYDSGGATAGRALLNVGDASIQFQRVSGAAFNAGVNASGVMGNITVRIA